MKAQFEKQIEIQYVDANDIWRNLHDVDLLARCSSAVGAVTERITGQEWEVELQRKVGKFSMVAPLIVNIVEEASDDFVKIEARGKDRRMGARLTVVAMIRIDAREAESILHLTGEYEMTGRIAALGSSTVRRHADDMVHEFSVKLPEEMLNSSKKIRDSIE